MHTYIKFHAYMHAYIHQYMDAYLSTLTHIHAYKPIGRHTLKAQAYDVPFGMLNSLKQ